MMRAFVTGWPISHSKSPILHGYWLKTYEISGSYEALAIEPQDFPAFLTGLPTSRFIGGNITIPHKETAYESIVHRDKAAELIGAVNTVWLENDEVRSSNTDAYGFSANLDDFVPEWRGGKIATVMGAGGASRAVIFALLEAGYQEIRIANRTLSRAKALADRFGERCSSHAWPEIDELLKDSDILVNTSSVGMPGTEETPMPTLLDIPSHSIVTDIVYTPLETPILKAAKDRGLKTADGLGMLLHQAVPGFEKWFGHRPTVSSDLRQIILEAQ